MVRGLELGPATRVLDVGCGAGGFAIWCAAQFGCHVTGITICAEHVELGGAQCGRSRRRRGAATSAAWTWTPSTSPASSFDVVTNQEPLLRTATSAATCARCSGSSRRAARGARIDYNVRRGHSPAPNRPRCGRLRGFHLPSLIPLAKVVSHAKAAGFWSRAARGGARRGRAAQRARLHHAQQPRAAAARTALSRGGSIPRTRVPRRTSAGISRRGWRTAIGLHTGLFEHGCFRAREGPQVPSRATLGSRARGARASERFAHVPAPSSVRSASQTSASPSSPPNSSPRLRRAYATCSTIEALA